MGYNLQDAARIVELLEETQALNWYLGKAKQADCYPLTRVSEDYPQRLRQTLGLDAPGCLFYKGDLSFLRTPCISLVGSRDLRDENARFAAEVGRQAALQGYTLISGNARGADTVAQNACLQAGGQVISIIADSLSKCPLQRNVLYLSQDGYDLGFSPQRALLRNHLIHALPQMTFVAQCSFGKGGTWGGTVFNLKNRLSPVFCFNDGSQCALELCNRGADLITQEQLLDFSAL